MNPDYTEESWYFNPSIPQDGGQFFITGASRTPGYYSVRQGANGNFSADMLRELANWILAVIGPA